MSIDDGSVWVVSVPVPADFHSDFQDDDGELLPELERGWRRHLSSMARHPIPIAQIASAASDLAFADGHRLEFMMPS